MFYHLVAVGTLTAL